MTLHLIAFATAPDDNYGTCQHCALLVAYDNFGAPKRAFYPKNVSSDAWETWGEFGTALETSRRCRTAESTQWLLGPLL